MKDRWKKIATQKVGKEPAALRPGARRAPITNYKGDSPWQNIFWSVDTSQQWDHTYSDSKR
jgi:hypothetical protein